jgi:uncharacterized protein DUF1573
MKRQSSLALAAILALCLLASPAAPLAAAQPKAVAVEPLTDLGTIAKGEKVTHDFLIRNDGDAPLEITGVRPACGCTVAEFDKTVAPGKTGTVHTLLDTASFNGAISKGVTVTTNDPSTPEIQLTLKLSVQPYIMVKPGYARFTTVQGESKEGVITQTLWASDEAPFNVVKVESPQPGLTLSFREAKEEERKPEGKGKQWLVDIKLANSAPVGPLANYVSVYTDHPKQKIVQIPVTGIVRPVIAVTPPVADFGRVELKEPLTKAINVRNFATEAINVTKVDSSVKGIVTEIKPVEAGREYLVRLTLKPEMAKGQFTDRLTLHTDSAKVPTIQVDVKGTVL